jgi:hypothetical protein
MRIEISEAQAHKLIDDYVEANRGRLSLDFERASPAHRYDAFAKGNEDRYRELADRVFSELGSQSQWLRANPGRQSAIEFSCPYPMSPGTILGAFPSSAGLCVTADVEARISRMNAWRENPRTLPFTHGENLSINDVDIRFLKSYLKRPSGAPALYRSEKNEWYKEKADCNASN